MKQNHNLFIVKTPLQIINSIEAIDHFKLQNDFNTIIVIQSKETSDNDKQMQKIISLYKWDDTIYVTGKLSYFTYISLIKQLQKQEYNYMFFARFGSIQRLIIANTTKKDLYYFDDGTETITMYNDFLLPNKVNKFNSRQLARVRFMLAGLKINITDTINLFTYFDLEPFQNTKVVNNNLSYFREKYLKVNTTDDTIYLLGQPLIEKKLLPEDIYINSIKNIINSTSQNIIYIPHKGEDKNSKVLSLESTKFRILPINIPIELYFLENKIEPKHLISFFTTAFFTLKLFYPKTKFQAIYFNSNLILQKAKIIESHYKFIKDIGIEYIDYAHKKN